MLLGKKELMQAIQNSIFESETKVRQIFLDCTTDIHLGTPVGLKTGGGYVNARNSWVLSQGSPAFGSKVALSNYEDFPLEIAGIDFYFLNEKPYINHLEYGLYPTDVELGTWDKRNQTYTKRSKGGWSLQADHQGSIGWTRLAIMRAGERIAELNI